MNIKELKESPVGQNYAGDPKSEWRVVCAAMRHAPTGLIVAGSRHFDKVIRAQIFALQGFDKKDAAEGKWDGMSSDIDWKMVDQGFIDNFGDFLTREEAWYLADFNGQIINQKLYGHEGWLYSENLY